MRDLAGQERFEEAALARDRLRALAEALARARSTAGCSGTGEPVLRDAYGRRLVLRRGGLDPSPADRRWAPRARAIGRTSSLPCVHRWFAARSASRPPTCRSPNWQPAAPSCIGCSGRLEHAIARADYGRTTARLTIDGDRGHPRRRANAHRPLPRFVRRSCRPSTWACSPRRNRCVARTSNPTPSSRRSSVTPDRPGTVRTRASGERSGRRARRGLRLQRERRVRFRDEGGAARRAADRARRLRGRAGGRDGEHDAGPVHPGPDANGLPDGRRAGTTRCTGTGCSTRCAD